jgi:hypothetical protein
MICHTINNEVLTNQLVNKICFSTSSSYAHRKDITCLKKHINARGPLPSDTLNLVKDSIKSKRKDLNEHYQTIQGLARVKTDAKQDFPSLIK